MKALDHIAANSWIRVLSPVQTRAARYRTHAAECAEFARNALSHEDKAMLEDMVVVWRHLEELVERFDLK